MSVLIGGGSGFVGRHLVKQLTDHGMGVTLVSRSIGPDRMTWGDLRQNGLPEGCSAVVSMSGENTFLPLKKWNLGLRHAVYSSRVDCTKLLAKAICQSSKPPKVFVCMSGVTYYRPSLDAEYDEDSKGGNFDFMSELCKHWEAAAKLPSDVKCRQVIIRSGLVLGDGGLVKQFYWPFFLGVGGRFGSGKQWFPWIHVTDLAGIITYAIRNDNVSGIFNAVAPQLSTNADFTKSFASAMKRPSLVPVPEYIIKKVYTEDMAKIILQGQKVIPKRTLQTGFKFTFPDLDSACKDLPQMLR